MTSAFMGWFSCVGVLVSWYVSYATHSYPVKQLLLHYWTRLDVFRQLFRASSILWFTRSAPPSMHLA